MEKRCKYTAAFFLIIVGACAFTGRYAAAQDQIHLAQCAGDLSLPIVAKYAEQQKNLETTWTTISSGRLRADLTASLRSGSPSYDGIWGCPLDAFQDLFDEGGVFFPAESYSPINPPSEFYGPGQEWYPVTFGVGVVCIHKSGSIGTVRTAIEKDPTILLSQEFQSRIGFADPILEDTGYNWLASFAAPLGGKRLEEFAQEFLNTTKPVFGAGCTHVAEGQIDVAFSTWFDASRFADKLAIVVPRSTWAVPYVFALLKPRDATGAANSLIETLMQEKVREELGEIGEVALPPQRLEVNLRAANFEFLARIHRAPSSSPDYDSDEFALAAAAASADGCDSDSCKDCGMRRCRLCKNCTK